MKLLKGFVVAGIIGLMAGCTEMSVEPEANQADAISGGVSMAKSSLVENGLPKLKFSAAGKKEQNTRLRLVDTQVEGLSTVEKVSVSVRPRKRPELLFQEWDNLISEHQSSIQASVVFPAAFKETFANDIVTLNILYVGADGSVLAIKNFDVFVSDGGTTALQKPTLTNWNAIDSTPQEESDGRYTVNFTTNVADDPAGEVAEIQVKFADTGSGIKPLENPIYLTKSKDGSAWNFHVWTGKLAFEGVNPVGSSIGISMRMLNAKGEPLSEQTEIVEILKGDFTGRIRRIRIRETSDNSTFRIGVAVTGVGIAQSVASVKVDFNATNNPVPVPQTCFLTPVRENTDKGTITFVYKPLTFEGGVMPFGEIYNVTATMLTANGIPIGEVITRDVIVESKDTDESVKLLDTSIRSLDGGKTWELQAKVATNGFSVVSVGSEFNGPFEGPAPVNTKLNLKQKGEEPGGVVVYTAVLEFEAGKSPLGFEYGFTTTIVYKFGIGTRTTTSQANNKAELL